MLSNAGLAYRPCVRDIPMEMRELRSFLAVADAGSITAATRHLHVTQPALSRQIQALERQLDLVLFERRNNRMLLTSAGHQMLRIARDLLAHHELADKAASTIRAGALPAIAMCAPATTLTDVIAPFLATWGPDDPMPSAWAASPPSIYESLRRGADLVVGTEPPPPGLGVQPIAVLPVWAYVPPGNPWARRRSVTVNELVDKPLLALEPAQHARRALDAALVEAGVSAASITEFGTPEVAQAVAAAGRGVAIVSDDSRFGLLPIAITAHRRKVVVRLFAAWAADHHAAVTLSEIAERLSRFCLQRYGTTAVSDA